MSDLFESRYFRGQGPLFIAGRTAAGVPNGLVFAGDITSADLTPAPDRVKVKENVTGTGGVAASFNRGMEYTLSVVFRSIKPSHLARILHGTSTTKAGTSVTDEAHLGYHDKFTALDYTKVSAVTVTGASGTPTYTVTDDYIVHADEGMIEIVSTGAIGDGGVIEVDYTYADQHHINASPSNEDLYLVFAGMNSSDNDKQCRCEMYKVNLDPGVLGLISDEAQEMTVSGEVLIDTLRAAGDQYFAWKTED